MYMCVVQWTVQGVKKVKKEHTQDTKAKVSKKVKKLKRDKSLRGAIRGWGPYYFRSTLVTLLQLMIIS